MSGGWSTTHPWLIASELVAAAIGVHAALAVTTVHMDAPFPVNLNAAALSLQ